LNDEILDTIHFFKPDNELKPTIYRNELYGLQFPLPKDWKIDDNVVEGTPIIRLTPFESKSIIKIIIEPVNPKFKFDLYKFVSANLAKHRITKNKDFDIKIGKQERKKTELGFDFEEISFAFVSSKDEKKVLSLLKQNIFFESNFGVIVQVEGDTMTIDAKLLNEIVPNLKFFEPFHKK
jgi:hypothetical protein